jgi:hypothetical protein
MISSARATSRITACTSDTFANLNLPMVERVADVVIRGVGLVAY